MLDKVNKAFKKFEHLFVERDDSNASIHQGMGETVFLIGLGGSEQDTTVRFPAYILPALQVAAELSREGERIKIRIFKADNLAASINGFNRFLVEDKTLRTFTYLKEFIRHFFFDLLPQVTFERDVNWDTGISENSVIDKVVEILRTSGELAEEFSSISRMGLKHGGEQGANKSIRYAAAHPIYSQLIMHENCSSLFTPCTYAFRQPALIVEFGGRPQITFNRISRYLAENSVAPFKATNWMGAVQTTGTIPPYYHAQYGEWVLGNAKPSSSKFDRHSKQDYKILCSELGENEFTDFLKNYIAKEQILIKATSAVYIPDVI